MSEFPMIPLKNNVVEMFIGPFGSSLKNECFVDKDHAYCMVYEQKHAIQKTMDVETRYVDEKKYLELSRFNIHGGDIIVSCRGTIGETYIIPDNAPMGIMHPSIMKIRLRDGSYNRKYFNALLISRLKKHETEANGSGIKMAISAKELGEELFPVPPMNIQENVVDILDRVKGIIEKRKQELQSLDDLIKARFVEMFGDIKSNDKYWPKVQMKEIVDIRGRVGWKGYKKEDLRESGPLVLGATHLTDSGELDLTAPVYLSREKYEESPEIVLQKDDLIFTQRGNTIGKVGLVEQEIGEATINPCVLILRPQNVNPIYLKRYFVMDETKDDMWLLNSGSAQPMITQKGIGEYYLMLPPEELQCCFADFVKQVDKSKVAVKSALNEAQLLFDSLMQQYFG